MSEKRIGYARVACLPGDLDEQIARLKAAGCAEVFSDAGKSGPQSAHSGFSQALAAMHAEDTLVVCRTDRLSRNLSDLRSAAAKLMSRSIELESLDDAELARALCNRINNAPTPEAGPSPFRYLAYRIGKFLVGLSRHGLVLRAPDA